MAQINQLAQDASHDLSLRQQLIADYDGYILACAAKTVGHRVTRSDDEWSIALSAFNEAIDCYNMERGSFLSYAQLVIRNRIIDDLRTKNRLPEFAVPPEAFTGEGDEPPIYKVTRAEAGAIDESLRDELHSANEVLMNYGFSFFDLAGHTPRKRRPRMECGDAVDVMQTQPPLIDWMRAKRRLPLNRLCELSGARKKTLSLFRNFVIAATEILLRDYPSLRRYFHSFFREVDET